MDGLSASFICILSIITVGSQLFLDVSMLVLSIIQCQQQWMQQVRLPVGYCEFAIVAADTKFVYCSVHLLIIYKIYKKILESNNVLTLVNCSDKVVRFF